MEVLTVLAPNVLLPPSLTGDRPVSPVPLEFLSLCLFR